MIPCYAVCNGYGPKGLPKKHRCGRISIVSYRIEYTTLWHYHQHGGKNFDVLSFCKDHSKSYATKIQYARDGQSLYGTRGDVDKVIKVPLDDNSVRRDETLRLMANFKGKIKRMVRQENAKKVSFKDWEEVFRECLQEIAVEDVHTM